MHCTQAYCDLPISSGFVQRSSSKIVPVGAPTATAAAVILKLASNLASLLQDKEDPEDAEDDTSGDIRDHAKAISFCLAKLKPNGSAMNSRGKGNKGAIFAAKAREIKKKHTEVLFALEALCFSADGSADGSAIPMMMGDESCGEKCPNQVCYHAFQLGVP